MIKEL